MTEEDFLSLKWGVVRDYSVVTTEFGQAIEKYMTYGISLESLLTEPYNNELDVAILDVINSCNGKIFRATDGKIMSKEEAISYVNSFTWLN